MQKSKADCIHTKTELPSSIYVGKATWYTCNELWLHGVNSCFCASEEADHQGQGGSRSTAKYGEQMNVTV